jgi:hypothetical protein
VGTQVPLGVHRHEGRQLDDARVHASTGAGVARGHRVDDLAFEGRQRLGGGHRVDAVGVHPRVDRPGHEGQAAGLGGVALGGEQCDGRQDGDGGLTDRDHVGVRAQVAERLHDVLDVLVEPEGTVLDRDVPGVVPVEDVHVVVPQQGADGGPDQRREVPRHRPDDQHAGLPGHRRLLEVEERGERRPQRRALGHGGRPGADRHGVDPERRAVVGRTGVGDDVAGRPGVTDAQPSERGRHGAQRPRRLLGRRHQGRGDAALQFVRGVEHADLPVVLEGAAR